MSFTGVEYKAHYQAFWGVLIDLIVEFLVLIIKSFDNQTGNWNPVSNDLIIKSFDIIIWQSVSILSENVYKTFTHKSNKTDSNHWVSPYDNHLLCTLSPTNLLPTVGYLRLRASCCFPAVVKTRSIPPPDPGQPWNCLHILTTSGYVHSFTWACPDRWPFQ